MTGTQKEEQRTQVQGSKQAGELWGGSGLCPSLGLALLGGDGWDSRLQCQSSCPGMKKVGSGMVQSLAMRTPTASLEHTAWKLRALRTQAAERGLQPWALTPHATTRPSYPSFCSVTWSLQENTGPPELGFSVMF